MEIPEEKITLTASQKAKMRYYQKNRVQLLKQIADINNKRYQTDDIYRAKILQNYKNYYNANKDKKKEYYLMKKSLKQEVLSVQ